MQEANVPATKLRYLTRFYPRVIESLASMGIDPLMRRREGGSLLDVVMHEICRHHDRGLSVKDAVLYHYETGSSRPVNLLSVTGRMFRIGDPVWFHDNHIGSHPIIGKGILTAFNQDGPKGRVWAELGNHFVYSDSRAEVVVFDQGVQTQQRSKLYRLQPILPCDLLKEAWEIKQERDELERKCHDASQGGKKLYHTAKDDKLLRDLRIQIGGGSDQRLGLTPGSIDRSNQHWDSFLWLMLEEAGVEDESGLEPWTTLGPRASEAFHAWDRLMPY